jgi:hypothetical protein
MNSVARNDRPSESSSHARDALEFAERIAAICSRVLGEIVASLVVHGSLALGDYTHATATSTCWGSSFATQSANGLGTPSGSTQRRSAAC